MVKVNFHIGDNVVLTGSFDEQPLVKANYIFNGMNHYVGSVTTNDDGSFNYYLLYDNRSFYEANGFLRPYNCNFNPLATFGTIKGFL